MNIIPICFVHIGKTGGNSINNILSNKSEMLLKNEAKSSKTIYKYFYNVHEIKVMKYKWVEFQKFIRQDIIRNRNTNQLANKQNGQLNQSLNIFSTIDSWNFNDMKFVFFVRDPMKRFISAFTFTMIDDYFKKQDCLKFRSLYGNDFKTPNDLAESIYTDCQTKQTLAQNAMKEIYHMESIKRYLISPENLKQLKDNILFVGRFEHFEHDAIQLCYLLGVDKPDIVPHFHNLSEKHDNYKDMFYLSDIAKRNLRMWYQHDYELIKTLIDLNKIDSTYIDELI